jgi:ABC-type dipeptide/oligopeptide/nickel transport system permease subunit
MAQQTEQLISSGETTAISPAAPRLDGLRRSQLSASPGFWRRAWRRYRQNSVSVVALFMVGAIVLFVLSADLISKYVTGFTYSENHLAAKLTPPFTDGYILGADGNGRDVLTRLAFGGRISLMIAVLGTASILAIGGAIGAAAGFFGGIIDSIGMRLADVLLSIPSLSLLIVVSSFYQPSPPVLALFIALISWAGISRLIRAEVLSLKSRDYVDAARVIGASNSRIIFKHILPNVVPIIVVWASIVIPALILTEAALSYLGLGVRTPTPSWGNMLQDAKQFLRQSWTLIFIPGFAIYITVLSINLVGTGLRDALDPRLNQ